METQEVKVTIDGDTKELVIRKGDAVRLFNIERMNLEGTIVAPGDFATLRTVKKETDHVIYDRDMRMIKYVFNERYPEGGSVTGKLCVHPDLKYLHINEKNTYSLRELAETLKFSRIYFEDREEHAKIISALRNYTATIATEVASSSDDRGNSKNMRDKKVTSNVPVEFTLTIPLLIGFPAKKFRVEVCFDSTDGGTKVWLESVEMAELMISEREKIMNAEIEKLRALGVVVIEQ